MGGIKRQNNRLFVDAEGSGPVEAEVTVGEEVSTVLLEREEHGNTTGGGYVYGLVVAWESGEKEIGGA